MTEYFQDHTHHGVNEEKHSLIEARTPAVSRRIAELQGRGDDLPDYLHNFILIQSLRDAVTGDPTEIVQSASLIKEEYLAYYSPADLRQAIKDWNEAFEEAFVAIEETLERYVTDAYKKVTTADLTSFIEAERMSLEALARILIEQE